MDLKWDHRCSNWLFSNKQKVVCLSLFLHDVGENRLLTPCNCRLRAVSLFSWSVEQNARDTQMTTRVRACTPLTKSEEKERMLAVYYNCESNGSDRLRKGRLLAPLSLFAPLPTIWAGRREQRNKLYAKSGKGDLPEAKPAHQGEIPLNHEGNTRNNGIKFLQLLRQGQCREDYAG